MPLAPRPVVKATPPETSERPGWVLWATHEVRPFWLKLKDALGLLRHFASVFPKRWNF